MRYSILTPTLIRPTLKRLCDSIDIQTNGDYEHIVIIDCVVTPEKKAILDGIVPNPRRKFITCSEAGRHPKDFGNKARREGYDIAQGEYILQIDDDDYYADAGVFETLTCVVEKWAVFPVLARGIRCHPPKPALGQTGSAMFMYRRDTGMKFPDNLDYSADGQLVEQLKKNFPYQSLDDSRELVIYPQANEGREQHEIDEWVIRHTPIKYAKDGLTIDWNQTHHRRKG